MFDEKNNTINANESLLYGLRRVKYIFVVLLYVCHHYSRRACQNDTHNLKKSYVNRFHKKNKKNTGVDLQITYVECD